MSMASSLPQVPASFSTKKSRILAELAIPNADYTDKSPKGSVDVQILDLIGEINSHEGLVTTSSCAGRVAVFVEGPKDVRWQSAEGTENDLVDNGDGEGFISTDDNTNAATAMKRKLKSGPGGKGGGRWLYVSHDPFEARQARGTICESHFTDAFGLEAPSGTCARLPHPASTRLIRLSFSPLILHIFCASLHHAKPLLAAAINAGFRESGVQSLKALDDAEHGAMVAVRSAGLAFETVVGVVIEKADGHEVAQAVVTEDYLSLCADITNERFKQNLERKDRLRQELRRAVAGERIRLHMPQLRDGGIWEDKEERKRRKRAEGLQRQQEQASLKSQSEEHESHEDVQPDNKLHAIEFG